MKKALRFIPTFLVAFAIAGSPCGVQRADAETISMFTGTFDLEGTGIHAFTEFQGFQNLTVLFPSLMPGAGFLTTDPAIDLDNYFDDHGCDNAFPCEEHWSGTFNGGSMSLVAFDGNGHTYSFTGTITGGSFSGDFHFDHSGTWGGNNQTLSFTARSTNGWTSDGTLTTSNDLGDPFNGKGRGTLSMTTVTPEPGSMTLLGSGIVAVAAFLRRRPKRLCSQAQQS